MLTNQRFVNRLLCLAGMLSIAIGFASAQQYVLRSITTVDGLPSDFVNHFYQDKDGFMWMATDKGACKFDGNKFVRYTVDSGLINNFTISVHQERSGGMWFSCFSDSALTKYIPGNSLHFKAHNNALREFFFDSENRLYYPSVGGFFALDRHLPLPPVGNAHVYAAQLGADSFLVMYPGRFYLLDVSNKIEDKVSEIPYGNDVAPGNLLVHGGKVYIMGASTLAEVNIQLPRPWEVRVVQSGLFLSYTAVGTDSSLLFGNQSGLWEYTFRNQSLRLVNSLFGLPDIGINDLYRDKNGLLWIATHGAGVVICPRQPVLIAHSPNERIVGIAGDGKETWLVSANALYQLEQGHLKRFEDKNIYQNSGIYHTEDGWWLSDYQFLFGPARYPSQLYASTSLHIPNGISSLLIQKNKIRYIGTYADGIIRMHANGQKDTFTVQNGLCSNTIEKLFQLTNGIAAVSYSNGFSIITAGDSILNFSRRNGMLSNTVYAVHQQGDAIWAGLEGGLAKFVNNKLLLNATAKEGIAGERVLFFFTAANGKLYFLTEKYLHLVDGDTIFPLRSVKIVQRQREIIQSYYYCRQTNMLYAGTSGGVVQVPMDKVYQQTELPDISLLSISTPHRFIDFKQHRLQAKENAITYRFGAQAFLHGTSPEIYCLLEGADSVYKRLVGNYELTYANLSPGTYTLLVYCKNADGISTAPQAMHTFTIAQLWWRQWWFIALGLVLCASFFWWLAWRWQKRRFAVKMDMLRLQEEKQVQRDRIRRDLHDNIGSQLSYMASQMDWIIQERDNLGWPQQQQMLETLGENTREVLAELRDSMWSMKYDVISTELMANRIQQIMHKWQFPGNKSQLVFVNNVPAPVTLPPHTALTMLRIFQEALANACTHAQAAHIRVRLAVQPGGLLELSITDDGQGFDTTGRVEDHYGLENMERRASEAGFSFNLRSVMAEGTTVIISTAI